MSNKKNRNKERNEAKAAARNKASGKSNPKTRGTSINKISDGSTPWIQMIPLAFFTAIVIMIVRMYSYNRDMNQFYWSNNQTGDLVDFFSYYKAIAILACAILAILVIGFKLLNKSWKFENPYIYIPIGVIVLFVLISYLASDYKEFSLMGYNDRFEGTLVWIAYMVVLVYAINIVKGERNVKWVVYPVVGSSFLLGILGLYQSLGHDPFQTTAMQKLIVPNVVVDEASGVTYHQLLDVAAERGEQLLTFTFQNNEIYQTVYNINYVSFYLTLLLPIFAMLFIKSIMQESKLYTKIIWALCFMLSLYNFVGSASSGGLIGLGVAGLLAIILLNKRLLKWWKPVAGVLAVSVIIMAITSSLWMPEWGNAVKSSLGISDKSAAAEGTQAEETAPAHTLHSISTNESSIDIAMDDMAFSININAKSPAKVTVTDESGKNIKLVSDSKGTAYSFADQDFYDCALAVIKSESTYNYAFTANNSKMLWNFRLTDDGMKYVNAFGKGVDLIDVPAIGFENNQSFGSGRGWIWSRSIPMLKSTVFIGNGADTYCIYYPQNDYVTKYNNGSYSNQSDLTVDKPHNMYLAMGINTGCISLVAFIALLLIYAIQTIKLYWKRQYNSFIEYVGIGIFFGVMGFAATGLVDDSSVSVMPMFFGLMGTGMAINVILKKQQPAKVVAENNSIATATL